MDIHRITDIKNRIGYSLLIYQLKIKAYVKDDNDIIIKYDIVKAISFNAVISGTTAVFVDVVNIFGKRSFKENQFKIKNGAQETHEVCWKKDSVEVTKSKNVSVPEIIPLTKIQRYAKNDLFVKVVSIIKSVNPELWLKAYMVITG